MEIIKVSDTIFLNQIQLEDTPEIFEAVNSQRGYLCKWLPFVDRTKKLKDTQDFIKSVTEVPVDKMEYVFVIRYTDNFAGIIGFRGTERLNKKTELGYWLSEPCQGKGIITKSVEKLIEFTFDKMEMNRLTIRCAVGNEKSKKIPQRLNFKFEGIERAGELMSDGSFTDLEVYSLLHHEVKFDKRFV